MYILMSFCPFYFTVVHQSEALGKVKPFFTMLSSFQGKLIRNERNKKVVSSFGYTLVDFRPDPNCGVWLDLFIYPTECLFKWASSLWFQYEYFTASTEVGGPMILNRKKNQTYFILFYTIVSARLYYVKRIMMLKIGINFSYVCGPRFKNSYHLENRLVCCQPFQCIVCDL